MNLSKREIIIGTLTGILGNILYAIIQVIFAAVKPNNTLEFLKKLLTARIPLWYILLINLSLCAIFIYFVRKRMHKAPEFLSTTSHRCEGLEFRWVWKKNVDGKYTMDDFWPICPQCGRQLRFELYDPYNAYHCLSGHCYDLHSVLNTKRELIHQLKQEFSEYSDIIEYSDI